jgi:UDP-N-acetyl-2-amino-2-deoxyglucuronate dehydrogenase
MKNFAMIGAGGYVAPRHMQAIKETGNNLVAAMDINDSVGILDNYFPEAHFFTEFERFDRYIELLKRNGTSIDYVTVCSPNYLHDAHIRYGLRIGADVICEKPVVLNPWNVDALLDMEKETGHNVFAILQLRLHPSIIRLKEKIANSPKDTKHTVNLTYIASRGNWYQASWKGNTAKSGGISTNLGIHLFDMLLLVFGNVLQNSVKYHSDQSASGHLEMEKASVDWSLSIDANKLPAEVRTAGKRTFRNLVIDGESFDFSEGFEDLHTLSYEQILAGKGFRLSETKKATQLVKEIRDYQL